MPVALVIAALAEDGEVGIGEGALRDDGAVGAVLRPHLPLPQQEVGRLQALPDFSGG